MKKIQAFYLILSTLILSNCTTLPKRDIPYVACIIDVKGISKCKGVEEFTLPTELLDGYVAMPQDDYIDYVKRCEINANKVKKLME